MIEAAARMMEDNLNEVWNERDSTKRLIAIEKIFSSEANLFHVGDQVNGTAAINRSVSATQKQLPPDFVFTMLKPVIINNGMGRLIWGAGPAGKQPAATGMDLAHFENGKIKSLYVFLD